MSTKYTYYEAKKQISFHQKQQRKITLGYYYACYIQQLAWLIWFTSHMKCICWQHEIHTGDEHLMVPLTEKMVTLEIETCLKYEKRNRLLPYLLSILLKKPELKALVQFQLADVPHLMQVLPGRMQLV